MKPIKKILCSVDLSDHSAEVAEYAALLASKLGAEVTAIYVAPTLSQYTGFKVPQSDIHAFVGEIVRATGEVLVGYASDEILAKAKRDDMDLIVMGTHGRKGIDRIIFGSVAEKVVKNSPIPVLTIRPHD